jgi:enterochelin esterase-like enzyme
MDNLRLSPVRLILASLILATSCAVHPSEIAGRLEILALESEVFGNTRKIRVWLPYDDAPNPDQEAGFPVLYLNDGEDLFDASESIYYTTEWMIDETVSSMLAAGSIEPVIVVGIDSGGRNARAREYLPYPDEYLAPPEPAPGGSRYASFLETEVLPLVESRYPVRSDKAGRALGGSSYGALVALYVAVTAPELFGQLLLESPSLYVDDDHVLRDVEKGGLDVDRIYLGAGTNEIGRESCGDHDNYIEVVRGVLDLSHILVAQSFSRDRILVNIEPCAEHSPAAWSRRLPEAVSFLYGD